MKNIINVEKLLLNMFENYFKKNHIICQGLFNPFTNNIIGEL
jgi:hypothetical protein